jgi:hypothetical protein
VAAVLIAAVVVAMARGQRTVLAELAEVNDDVKNLKATSKTVGRQFVDTSEQFYASQHPVYVRCAKVVDMPAFSAVIKKTCGNMHDPNVQSCSEPCALAMQAHSSKFGCCWETVMHTYVQIDKPAELAWRSWQGTLSGKCGITFRDKDCGGSMGESVYRELSSEVEKLKRQQAESRQVIRDLVAQTQGAAAQDLCLVNSAWVPCRDSSFFGKQPQSTIEQKTKEVKTNAAGVESKDVTGKHLLPRLRGKTPRIFHKTLSASAIKGDEMHIINTAWGVNASLILPKKNTGALLHARVKTISSSRSVVGTRKPHRRGRNKAGIAGMYVQPDYGVLVSKHATRKESAAEKARAKAKKQQAAFWPKAFWSVWPWQRGAFKNVAHTQHFKAHTRNTDPLGDRDVKLKHKMSVVDSPLPSNSERPLWDRLEKVATNGPKAKHGALWGRSHRWGPADNDITLPRKALEGKRKDGKAKISFGSQSGHGEEFGDKGSRKRVWVSRNSPWAPDAGFLDPHDPAAKRLSAAGINIDSDMGVI